MNVRIAAAKVIRSVLHDGESLNSILPGYLAAAPEKDRGLLQELCYGTLRWQPKLLCYLNQLLDKPFKHKDGDLEALLTCGLYQLIYLRIPPHAAVSETVALAMAEGALRASGADIAVSVTGIAGPTGGTPEKPVGTAWIGLARKGAEPAAFKVFHPRNRHDFKLAVSQAALDAVRRVL